MITVDVVQQQHSISNILIFIIIIIFLIVSAIFYCSKETFYCKTLSFSFLLKNNNPNVW